jgi:hypothetical protein
LRTTDATHRSDIRVSSSDAAKSEIDHVGGSMLVVVAEAAGSKVLLDAAVVSDRKRRSADCDARPRPFFENRADAASPICSVTSLQHTASIAKFFSSEKAQKPVAFAVFVNAPSVGLAFLTCAVQLL